MSTISTGHARKLVKNYKKLKINKKILESETRAVWFPKDEILEALKNPVDGIYPTGLRFYFAAYEEKVGSNPPKHAQDESKITLVIIPTKDIDNNGRTVPHPYRQDEIIHFDLLTGPYEQPEYDTDFREVNDGQICPPPPIGDLGLDNGL